MLRQRVLAAAVFAPLLLAGVAAGGLPLRAAVVALVAVALAEYTRLVGFGARDPLAWATWGLGAWSTAATLELGPAWLAAALAPALAVVPATAALAAGPPWDARLAAAGRAALGAVWCGALLPHLALVRELPGPGAIAGPVLLLSVWAADTGAYFGGRAFGRRRLAPAVSPGKTLEGALAGVVAALAAASLAAALAPGAWPWRQAASVAVISAVMGPLGDLAESMVKRAVGAKDSSRLIPGHGGVLDRFDALMFAAPAAYAYLRAVG